MKQEELNKIFNILSRADGGCEHCVAYLFKLFCEQFPEHKEYCISYIINQKEYPFTYFDMEDFK